jgi:hippurate hydrolase
MTRPCIETIKGYQSELITLRRDLHAHPELGYEETRTAAVVANRLRALGLEVYTGLGRTGVVGVLRGKRNDSGRAVGLRADMDALPIVEENTFAHRSRHDGKMHGCGHDGHTTMLLGAARYLAETKSFNGTVVFIFQPGEEGHAGARAMIEDGLFRRFPVDAVFALHNWPSLPAGTIGLNRGPMMAGIDRFKLTVEGIGGHGAHPHQAIDPIVATAQMITSLQTIVSRNVSPLDSAVLSFHFLQAGAPTALSVIPPEVKLAGMVKWYRAAVQETLRERLREVAASTAAAFRAKADLDYEALYPPTINAPEEADTVMRVGEKLFGAKQVMRTMEPSMGSEDFAFMLQQKPGAYFRLGQGGEAGCFLHNPKYDFNDDVIPVGIAMFAGIVEDRLPL